MAPAGRNMLRNILQSRCWLRSSLTKFIPDELGRFTAPGYDMIEAGWGGKDGRNR